LRSIYSRFLFINSFILLMHDLHDCTIVLLTQFFAFTHNSNYSCTYMPLSPSLYRVSLVDECTFLTLVENGGVVDEQRSVHLSRTVFSSLTAFVRQQHFHRVLMTYLVSRHTSFMERHVLTLSVFSLFCRVSDR